MKKENQLKNRNIIAKVNFPTQICKWLRENPKNTIFYLVIFILTIWGISNSFHIVYQYLEKIKEPKSDYIIYNIGPNTGTLFLVINLNNRKDKNGKPYVNPIKHKWFSNRDFRAAIDWAIDRENMVKNIASGVAEPLFTAESLNSIYLNKYIKGHPCDLEVAQKSLEKDIKCHLNPSGSGWIFYCPE